ncbi:M28 family peptidase [Singulisphaera acidiphila]|uniref:Putative aminopeptidase n=1 Tax=Singulisphaera acidiphila (strain ATCC BAA-1392 / DSM 18658 / VKM B-2454 / MOB10) TaxID=886293 RepID=L0DKL2_SINAD|nr:M28 family peptidase [Singulisphaera acidiphila]AGA29807.1 putative aminopeptidase [Singulisphaera acidiphila DSM 18658]
MKFDIDRAMGWVKTFDFPRGTGSEGERHAADLLAEPLEKSGWRVSRAVTRTGCRLSTLVMILLLTLLFEKYFLWKALQLSFPNLPRRSRLGMYFAAFLLIAGLIRLAVGRHGVKIARERFVAWRSAKEPSRLVNLIADRPGLSERPARVFILTHLDTPLRVANREDGISNAIILGLIVLVFLGFSPVWTTWSAAGIFLVSLLFQARYWLRAERPSAGDNRTGLALLAEMAQSLPTRLHERVEIHLVAVGGSSSGQLGALALADDIRGHWPPKPTLVINLDSPGLGPEIRLLGTGKALEVARGAAKDLWIPCRVKRRAFCCLDHRPFILNRIPAISLAGDRKGTRIEPANLAATVQLATEIALRWARLTAQPSQVESLPRSSQKPG